ncbi:MAG: Os1348 family NHLP clan protein [Ktedonobacteraceae bacterium]
MSWKTINRILGLAAINPVFRQQLQQDPRTALEAQGFELAQEELEAFSAFASLPFSQFCQRLSETLAPDEHSY